MTIEIQVCFMIWTKSSLFHEIKEFKFCLTAGINHISHTSHIQSHAFNILQNNSKCGWFLLEQVYLSGLFY